ncbi:MAG: CDP-diacylglycerol--serine O-phosphatidyltransferase [Candidatus Cloacimonetes bacterium]|nr:CDP-diacylglycerol--serine O-phosphatidyltransferase [Candidatus Cloacimonadota bacterium]
MNKRLAYAIPNIFTALSLICALVALNLASNNEFIQAAWVLTLSLLLDGLDGKMARLLKATSKIGAEADSLADFAAFGVVPGFLSWQVGLKHLGLIGFIVFVFYIICGGYRLARYNVITHNPNKKENFLGLPIPAAAAAICSFILFNEIILRDYDGYIILLLIMILMGFLMISHVPYIAVNKSYKKKKQISIISFLIATIAILAIKYTVWVYLITIWLYVLYGMVNFTILAFSRHNTKDYYIKNRKGL